MSAESDDTSSSPLALNLSRAQKRLVLWTVLAGVAASSFPVTVLSAALPEIADDFGTTDSVISWVLSAPLLALAVGTPIAGKLGDVYGHRRVYLIGFLGATALSFATALAWNAGSLIALRTVAQACGAATGPAAMAIIMRVFEGEERGPALGAWSAVSAASPTVGIVAGGPLVDATGWQAIFVIQGALSVIALLVAFRVLPETVKRGAIVFDIPGALTLGGGVTAGLFAINRGPAIGWDHPLVLAGLVLCPAALTAFVFIEQRVAAPLLPLSFLRKRGFSIPVFSQLFSNSAYMGTFIITPVMLERLFGYSTTTRALVMLGRPISFSGASWIGGRQQRRLGLRVVTVAGAVGIAIGCVLTGVGGHQSIIPLVVVALIIAGAGQGYGRPALITSVGNSVGDADLGIGSAVFGMSGQIGASVGITVMSTLLGDSTSPDRFLLVYGLGGVLALVAVWMYLLLPEQRDDPNNQM